MKGRLELNVVESAYVSGKSHRWSPLHPDRNRRQSVDENLPSRSGEVARLLAIRLSFRAEGKARIPNSSAGILPARKQARSLYYV